jgi:hypothetical protein
MVQPFHAVAYFRQRAPLVRRQVLGLIAHNGSLENKS